MGHLRNTERSMYFQELSQEEREKYLKITLKKFMPTIDNLYYSVFIKDDGKEHVMQKILNIIEKLERKKQEAKDKHENQQFSNGLVVSVKSAAKRYSLCLTEEDLYDIFFMSGELPNDKTNRIQTQLRSFGLWTRGLNSILDESFRKLETILNEYELEINYVLENRIDYCYHTNIKTDLKKIFHPEKGDSRFIKTRLKRWNASGDILGNEDGTELNGDYYLFGERGGAWVVRFYDKVREVIEMGYKSYFFQMWYENGLISFYDKFCMEYAFLSRNMKYLHKGRLKFYVEYGKNEERRKKYDEALNSSTVTLKTIEKMADEFMPPVTPVINIEYQTMRDFYREMDDAIDNSRTISNDYHPKLKRIYQIIDNRETFLDYLTGKGFSFQENDKYLDWWNRLRNTKVGGIKADEHFLREYSHKMDKATIERQGMKKIASFNVIDNRNKTDIDEDIWYFYSNLTDNAKWAEYLLFKEKAEMRYKNRKSKQEFEEKTMLKDDYKDAYNNLDYGG